MIMKNRVIPVLLLKDSGLIKTKKFDNPKYVGDPINAIKIFNQKEVDEMIFLDIGASINNKLPNFDLIEDIASECFMPLAYGGGIKDLNCAERLINVGIEKIVINSIVLENISFINELSQNLGSQSVVVSLDIKKSFLGSYKVYSYLKKEYSSVKLDDFLVEVQNQGAGEIFINCVDNDGMMAGYDLALLDRVMKKVKIPVVFCGGAGSLDDLKNVSDIYDYVGLAAGSLFVFKGPHRAVLINYPTRNIKI